MGTCLSKNIPSTTSNALVGPSSVSSLREGTQVHPNVSSEKISAHKYTDVEEARLKEKLKKVKQQQGYRGEGRVKKEIFVIKHRNSYDERERNPTSSSGNVSLSNEAPDLVNDDNKLKIVGAEASLPSTSAAAVGGVGVRNCSCTKEEMDAILIQRGMLSRSSSGKATATHSRKCSRSKRSYDFDHFDYNDPVSADDNQKRTTSTERNSDLCEDDGRGHQHRQRHCQSPRSSSQGRRRKPSREREQNIRSSSRERRVSRSPGRRSSETNSNANFSTGHSNGNGNNKNSANIPGKMVSVPATVTSMVMDKITNGGVGDGGGVESAVNAGIKRISVRRNVGGEIDMGASKTATSPRSQSPARANAKVLGDNQQQPSLSRSSSRKAEQSPHRRNPLGEIDNNPLAYPQATMNGSKVQSRNRKELDGEANLNQYQEISDKNRVSAEWTNNRSNKRNEQQIEKGIGQSSVVENIKVKTVAASGTDSVKPQTLARTRSSRRSRDLDLNLEEMVDAGQSYTALLLQDIHNFHQKNTPSVQIPACVTKACFIVEAVNDLTSSTSSDLPCAFSEDRSPPEIQLYRNDYCDSFGVNCNSEKMTDTKDPFAESEVVVFDDVMEPSFHKYVTLRRVGAVGGGDMLDQESSGSDSYLKSDQRQWGLPSSSEPTYADTTDCSFSRWNSKGDQRSPMSLVIENRSKINGRRQCDHEHSSGIGRGRLGCSTDLQAIPYVTAAASR